jgi:peptidoglycan/LPS O-acetylase OafA/YrhL
MQPATPASPLPRPAPLTPDFSLYLDAVRFCAALLVVCAHLVQHQLVSAPVRAVLPDWGREAVMLFFVLSGFVIAYTTEQKRGSLAEYCVARCARIYSVALPVLLAAFAAAACAVALGAAGPDNLYEVRRAWLYIPLHLLFTGELWTMSETPPWLPQYWSLGYEVWYYVLFGCAFYLRGWLRYVLTGAVFLLLGPKLWLLAPVWLSGVALYHGLKRFSMSRTMARLGWVLSVALLIAFHASGAEEAWRPVVRHWWSLAAVRPGSAERFLSDYVVCVLVLANFVCARHAAFGALARVGGAIRTLSAYTFTLYLLHELVISLWRTFHGHNADKPADVATLLLLIAAGTWFAGLLTEQRKHWFRAPFARLFGRLAALHGRIAVGRGQQA